ICGEVLILGGGRVLVHDSVEHLRKPANESVVLTLETEPASFGNALAERGVRFERGGHGVLRVYGDADQAALLALDAARRSGAVVRRLELGRNSLEDIYLSAVGADGGAKGAH